MTKPNVTQPFDENVKAHLRGELEKLGLHVETEHEAFNHARTIDLIAECRPEDSINLDNSIFSYFRTLNVIELKGPNDRLHISGFDRIMMRSWAANQLSLQPGSDAESEEQEQMPDEISDEASSEETDEGEPANFVPLEERTITIVSVVRPTKILTTLQKVYRFKKTDEPGVYLSDQIIPIRIIHPDELELVPKNYPLLCLSRGEKLQAFIDLCLEESLNEYLQFILTVGVMADTTAIWNHLMEVYKLKPVVQPETWGYIEEFFKEVPEAFESVPIIYNNIQRAQLEALKLGRKEGIELGREEGIEQGQKSGKVEQQRTMMLYQLERKFGDNNEEQLETIVEKIERTDDLELLAEWFDRILDAHFLHELDF